MDVLAIRATTHGTPLEADLRAFGKAFSTAPYEATAIDYDPDARRFRVTFDREVMLRLVRANQLPGTWTMFDGSRCQIVYRTERRPNRE